MAKSKGSGLFSLKIGGKLIAIFVIVSVAISVILAAISYFQGSSAIRNEAILKLGGIAELKTQQLETFIDNRYGEVHVITGLDLLRNAAAELETYIRNSDINPDLPLKEKWAILEENSQNYRLMKQYIHKYQSTMKEYAEIKFVAIYDMTNRNGGVVFREGDQLMSTNDFTGNVKERTMYRFGRDLMERKRDGVQTEKFNCPLLYSSSIEWCTELKKASVHLSHGIARPGVPMSEQRKNTPVLDRFSMMMIFDVNVESINSIMNESTGLGETGESYLIQEINGRLIMLTDSRFEKDTALKKDLSGVEGLQKHMEREEFRRGDEICQNLIYPDYRGISVLSHNHVLKFGRHTVGVITEIDESEVFGSVTVLLIEIVIAAGILIIIAIFAAVIFSRTISRPLAYGVSFAGDVANGDLTLDMDRSYLDRGDEIGDLARALGRMVTDLRQIINNIKGGTDQLVEATNQISMGNQDLSQRTSEQASSLEEIASTIEESTATINQNAENSEQARDTSYQASKLAEEGGSVVEDAVTSIMEINDSSKKIGEIISVINDIAFQTNLLALNAAVEAARAGEQGRGFAVVAGEVRNLAQRSGNAAKEIEDLIKDSVNKIEAGTNLVNKSGESIREIIESVNNVAKIIAEITAASEEQRQGMGQINTAITEMDTLTQNNASLVEETASASEEMVNQAQELLALVEHFKVDSSQEKVVSRRALPDRMVETGERPKDEQVRDRDKPGRKGGEKAAGDNNLADIMKDEGFEEF